MSNPELQALLATLRPRSQASVSNMSRERSREPSSSFLNTSQIPSTPPPPFSPSLSQRSPAQPGSAVAQNLLNLLNFHQTISPVINQHENQPTIATVPISSANQEREQPPFATDQSVVTSNLSGNRSVSSSVQIEQHSATQRDSTITSLYRTSANDSRNQMQQSNEQNSDSIAEPTTQPGRSAGSKKESGTEIAGKMDNGHESMISQHPYDKPIFTYKNPFEALKASRTEKSHSPQDDTPIQNQGSSFQAPENLTINFGVNEVVADRVKLTPKSRTSKPVSPQQTTQNSDTGDNRTASLPNEVGLDIVQPSDSSSRNVTKQAKHQPEDDSIVPEKPKSPSPVLQAGERQIEQDRLVSVLTFPVKAFVSITLQLLAASETPIREEGVMEISRLKKDFDQVDRSLAAASPSYITYAFVKNGGMRIIRQDDGSDRQVFKNSHDRIFNVSISTTMPPLDYQTILGTGISGAVYYATISRPGRDLFQSNEMASESLIFPAFPQADENTAGGALKTRAKRSSKHPEFFAIGRGKAIHIIWPASATSPRYGISDTSRTVDVEQLFAERPLQILTGKAGKDFTFSEDDTMIVSLDKTGRLRFWDIRKLIDEENAKSVQITPYIIDNPVLSLSTASPAEKSWPTSVSFVDKARPYLRGGPLRYVLVGLRQNHTLQLWDIALGKAVQEINFPHESETDGICSVNYHPGTGIIAVGHPTRNSIFFIHLSAPRYALSSSLSQASYVQRVAAKDPEIPKPESTACMSGIREINFGARGEIRSVEMLPVYKQGDTTGADNEKETLFELYVVHSKGVTCLAINREDLGWNAENKVIRNVDAEKEGLVVLKELKLGSVIEESVESKNVAPDVISQSKTSKKKSKKSKEISDEVVPEAAVDMVMSTDAANLAQQPHLETVLENATSKAAKRTKKKASQDDANNNKSDATKSRAAESLENTVQPTEITNGKVSSKQSPIVTSQAEELSMSISGDWLDKELRKIERSVSTEFRKELDQLYQNIRTDRTLQDEASMSRQEAILRLVSTTLDTNVEKSLVRILASQMQDIVVPSLVQSTSTIITSKIMAVVSELIPRELAALLPVQLEQTLQSPQMLLGIANNVTQRLTSQIQGEIIRTVSTSIASSMKSIASKAANDVFAGYDARLSEQFRDLQLQNEIQADRIEHLSRNLESVLSAVQSLTNSQAEFNGQFHQEVRALQIQSMSHVHSQVDRDKAITTLAQERGETQPTNHRAVSSGMVQSSIRSPAQRTRAEVELDEISYLMEQQRYEEGSIKWLQSTAPHAIFNELFVRYTPDYLATDVSSLVAFSIGVTLANELTVNTQQRLEWINAAFNTVDLQDREIVELAQHAPQLINGVVTKLENLYISRGNISNNDHMLDIIQEVAGKARELKHVFDNMNNPRARSHVIS